VKITNAVKNRNKSNNETFFIASRLMLTVVSLIVWLFILQITSYKYWTLCENKTRNIYTVVHSYKI